MSVASEWGAARARPSFAERFEQLVTRHSALWNGSETTLPELGGRYPWWRRLSNARATRRLIRELADRVETRPEDEVGVRAWRRDLQERLQRFGEERFDWPEGYRRLVFGEEFYDVTVAFARAARDYDPSIDDGDIGQAMRNVWIVNSLQMLFGAPVELEPPVFAYSLLYPYTDNLLDDPEVSPAAKRGLNERLECWLRGARATPSGERERRIHELVGVIERHQPRERFPGVYDSLLSIHRAQVRSLRLQGRGAVDADGVLAAQVEKGGASVLADGYLAFGHLGPREEDFCFGYGVFLQMLDDLQDARADREASHATLFSAAEPPLDRTVSRLWHYMREVVESADRIGSPELAGCRDLILRNCTTLLVGAIAEDPDLVSRRFRRRLERQWPLGLRSMRSLRRFAEATFGRTRRRLARRKGTDSLWDLAEHEPVGI